MNLFSFILGRGLNRSSLTIALDLIYAATKLEFPADKIVLGEPVEVDIRHEVDTDPNTFIPVLSVAEGFSVSYSTPAGDGFLYRRIPLSLITPIEDAAFEQPDLPFTTYQILDRINEKLGTQLTENDLLNETYTSAQQGLTLHANPKSLVWIDELPMLFSGLSQGRLLEDGSFRLTEDGRVRIIESASV